MKKLQFNSFGLLGGSFDPPHYGHLKISKIALEKLPIKKVVWIVNKKNPFKKKTHFSLRQRLLKCKKMTEKNKKIRVMYLDQIVNSPRTFKAINYFKKKSKEKIFFLIGSDNLIYFHKWKNYKSILKSCVLVVFSRKGYDNRAKKSILLKKKDFNNIIFVNNKKFNISSTMIKRKLI